MRREIVEDHVDVRAECTRSSISRKLTKSLDRCCFGLRHDLAGRDVERREEVHRAMADVVVRLAFGATQVHRQNRLRPLEGLNLRLFVE